MTWYKNILLSLKEIKGGKIILGRDTSTEVMGKWKFSLDNKENNVGNLLLVKDLKIDTVSVREMVDIGHETTFDSKGHRIWKEDLGKLIAKGRKNLNNVYVLREAMKKLRDWRKYILHIINKRRNT